MPGGDLAGSALQFGHVDQSGLEEVNEAPLLSGGVVGLAAQPVRRDAGFGQLVAQLLQVAGGGAVGLGSGQGAGDEPAGVPGLPAGELMRPVSAESRASTTAGGAARRGALIERPDMPPTAACVTRINR